MKICQRTLRCTRKESKLNPLYHCIYVKFVHTCFLKTVCIKGCCVWYIFTCNYRVYNMVPKVLCILALVQTGRTGWPSDNRSKWISQVLDSPMNVPEPHYFRWTFNLRDQTTQLVRQKQNVKIWSIFSFSEITSPNYPNSFNSTGLDCSWDVSALHGANVKLTVIEADVDEGCLDNTLTILDDSPHNSNSSLKYPGLSAQCGQSSLPRSDSVISDGVVSVKFHSLNNNHGTVAFKIIVEATSPEMCPGNLIDNSCPEGPCCQGEDCCVYHVGTIPKGKFL